MLYIELPKKKLLDGYNLHVPVHRDNPNFENFNAIFTGIFKDDVKYVPTTLRFVFKENLGRELYTLLYFINKFALSVTDEEMIVFENSFNDNKKRFYAFDSVLYKRNWLKIDMDAVIIDPLVCERFPQILENQQLYIAKKNAFKTNTIPEVAQSLPPTTEVEEVSTEEDEATIAVQGGVVVEAEWSKKVKAVESEWSKKVQAVEAEWSKKLEMADDAYQKLQVQYNEYTHELAQCEDMIRRLEQEKARYYDDDDTKSVDLPMYKVNCDDDLDNKLASLVDQFKAMHVDEFNKFTNKYTQDMNDLKNVVDASTKSDTTNKHDLKRMVLLESENEELRRENDDIFEKLNVCEKQFNILKQKYTSLQQIKKKYKTMILNSATVNHIDKMSDDVQPFSGRPKTMISPIPNEHYRHPYNPTS